MRVELSFVVDDAALGGRDAGADMDVYGPRYSFRSGNGLYLRVLHGERSPSRALLSIRHHCLGPLDEIDRRLANGICDTLSVADVELRMSQRMPLRK